ncbi:MAG: class I SAM-dependent methyltransferase [Ferruginibacter sp.]
MQTLKYIQYFFYLASNWNLRIAWHIIDKEIKGEKQYDIQTTGADELHKLEAKGIDISHATIYMPASYDMLEALFAEIKHLSLSHFLDIGCGKGRVMCVAAHHGFNLVTGIDFSKELCGYAKKNLEMTKKQFPSLSYKVINNDAFYYDIPRDVDCIFLFNPFDEMIMSGVIENIETSLEEFPRDIYILYLNPLHKKQFIENGYVEIFYTKKLKYLEGSILKKTVSC